MEKKNENDCICKIAIRAISLRGLMLIPWKIMVYVGLDFIVEKQYIDSIFNQNVYM